MSRLKQLAPDEMTAEQRRVCELISSTRKTGLGGPFSVWFRTPALAEPANSLHNAFRLHGALDRQLFEMLILIVAHEFDAKYVWTFHIGQARKAGLPRAIIDAIGENRPPHFTEKDQRVVHDLVRELLSNKTLSDNAFKKGKEALGEDLLIELVSAVGFYSTICLLVNAFDVPAPDPRPE
jgi:4-carboxymuconolactone decarboxylase